MIRTIETLDELSAIRNEWDALLASSRSRSVFVTHDWLCTWWKHLGVDGRLRVLTSHDGGRLIGILPLALRPSELSRMNPSMWEFLGSGVIGSDYLDVIVRNGAETKALAEFADYLDHAGVLLRLSQLRRGASTSEGLATALMERGWTGVNNRINVCPFINLSGQTWESYCSSLGSSQRYNFQRRLKNLEKLPGFRFECARTAREADAGLDILIGLHEKRWLTRDLCSEAFQTPAIRAFHKEFCGLASERDWVRLYVVWVDGRPAAALYGLRYEGVFSFYQSGFDPEFGKLSVGLVIMGLAIKAALDEGCTEYDFLHGDEEYKFHWTGQTHELGRLELFPAHARARFYRRAMDFKRTARRMAKRVLQMA